MSWGCKQKPNGCGWANRLNYTTGEQTWWCDLCERSGWVMAPITGGSEASSTSLLAQSASGGQS